MKDGNNELLPQWLLENGNNFDVLLDEAKKEVYGFIYSVFFLIFYIFCNMLPICVIAIVSFLNSCEMFCKKSLIVEPGSFVVNFKQISRIVLVFLLFTLKK